MRLRTPDPLLIVFAVLWLTVAIFALTGLGTVHG